MLRIIGQQSSLCGYWPDNAVNVRALVGQIPPPPTVEEKRKFKFEQLARGALSRGDLTVYFLACQNCIRERNCVPLRVNLSGYDPDASRSIRKKVKDYLRNTTIQTSKAAFDQETYALFNLYYRTRHPESAVKAQSFGAEDYRKMVGSIKWIIRLRDKATGQLKGASFLDEYDGNFSGEYQAYDQSDMKSSPGISLLHASLRVMKAISPQGFLYNGGWSPGSKKLDYKKDCIGTEYFRSGKWTPIEYHEYAKQTPQTLFSKLQNQTHLPPV